MSEIMKINKIIYFVLLIVISVSCTDDFEDYNKDPKRPEKLEGEFIFNNGQKELVDYLSNTNVNRNIFKLIAQYWTETTYTDEANYDLTNRNIPEEAFETYYRDVLKSFKEARELIEVDPILATETEAQKQNKIQIIRILEIYVYHNLVNIFGDVPFTEALNIENINPVYDDAATIYNTLFTNLDDAMSKLDLTAESFVGTNDHIYKGDVNKWMMFANSLKLKMAMSIADYDAASAQTYAQQAVTAGVMTSMMDNAELSYEGSYPNTNPLHEDLVLSGRSDFVVANTLVDYMNDFQDPRIFAYVTYPVPFPYALDDNDNPLDTTLTVGDGAYFFYDKVGGGDSIVYETYPLTLTPMTDTIDETARIYLGGDYGESNSFTGHSHINSTIESPTFPGILMTYDEVQFYIAEAAARSWSVGQTAADAYAEAIEASFDWWGVTGATTYIAQPDVAYDQANWKQLIGTQAYLAFYTRGLVAWDMYRRLDYPIMNESPDALTGGPVPTRFTYPVPEQTLNADNYYDAADAIGGDEMLTRLFWDIADPQ
jgi:hypothetical protein